MAGIKDASVEKTEEHVLQNVLAGMPVAVAWANPSNGRIEFVNRKFTTMFGYELEDLSTLQEWVRECYANPEQATQIGQFWQTRLQASSKDQVEMEDIELDILCKDRTVKTVLSGKILLPNRSGALSTFLDITPRKEEESLIRKQATEDPLTGLLNRRVFTQTLEECLQASAETGNSMAVMLIDLDGFKPVNDQFGHDQGDLLLIKVAGLLKQAMRKEDTLCRIGGDEFGVVLGNVSGEEPVQVVADRILQGLSSSRELGGKDLKVGASIGIAIYPDDGSTGQELFRHADQALYQAKNSGKGRWCR